jgi:hypothetical protein
MRDRVRSIGVERHTRKEARVNRMALCSIAIAAGVIGVVALVKGLVMRRRFFGGYGRRFAMAGCGSGYGGGCGSYGYDSEPYSHHGHGGWGRGWRGPGGSFWLRALFSRLDTTPGQEKEIRGAIEEFQKTAYEAKDEIKGSREDLAKAIGGEVFDEIAIGEANVRADATTRKVKDALEGALRKVHAVLDPKQRERLAELISKGPGFGRRWGGGGGGRPYRDAL